MDSPKRRCGDEAAKRFLKMSEIEIASISKPFVTVRTPIPSFGSGEA